MKKQQGNTLALTSSLNTSLFCPAIGANISREQAMDKLINEFLNKNNFPRELAEYIEEIFISETDNELRVLYKGTFEFILNEQEAIERAKRCLELIEISKNQSKLFE